MSFLSKLLKATRRSQTNDRTPSYTSNVTTAPTHSLPGRDSVRQLNEPESSLTETLGEAETSEVAASSPNYIYYRIYADDGAILSKAPVNPGDPFLGRIKARYVPPPRNVKAVKRSIENVENIKHCERTSLFLTPYSESPMDDAHKVTIINGTGPGSKPQEPLAFVSKMSDSSLMETLGEAEISEVATSNYIYYRIYTEDGSILSKTSANPDDPFLGRIVAEFVPPPHNAKAIKRSIAKVENIKDRESTTIFLTPYSKSPMDDADKFSSQNGTSNGPGYSAYAPVALVAKMSDSERTTLESDGRGGLASTAKPHPDIRHVYYVLYAEGYAIPSKVAFDPEEPFLGRIRADSVAPPHSVTTFKLCISRAESNPAIAYYANLFEDSCETPLKEGHISLRTDGPGLSPNEPMAIVLSPPILLGPDGKYLIKNRAADIYWSPGYNPVYFHTCTLENARKYNYYQWDIKHDT